MTGWRPPRVTGYGARMDRVRRTERGAPASEQKIRSGLVITESDRRRLRAAAALDGHTTSAWVMAQVAAAEERRRPTAS